MNGPTTLISRDVIDHASQVLQAIEALDRVIPDLRINNPYPGQPVTACIHSGNVQLLFEDPDAFWADEMRVEVEELRSWRSYFEEEHCQCRAVNSRGVRCGSCMTPAQDGPATFIVGYSDRCTHHRSDGYRKGD